MRPTLALCLFAISSAWGGLPPDEQARQHLSKISSLLTPAPPQELSCSQPTLVPQSPGQIYDSKLPPVWFARIGAETGQKGYAMWENSESGALLEFAVDGVFGVTKESGRIVEGVPALQQFAIPGRKAPLVASGCVPTAGASLVGFWVKRGLPLWLGTSTLADDEPLKRVASRLRSSLRMSEIPDTPGYTDDGLCLSGAYPEELARALERDARAHEVAAKAEFARFSFDRLREEIDDGRPVLLSCMVRLPQKPHLAWGHEVIGVGWLKIQEGEFAGVKDNFYPTASSETLRWIRKEAFDSLISVRVAGGLGADASPASGKTRKGATEQNNTP